MIFFVSEGKQNQPVRERRRGWGGSEGKSERSEDETLNQFNLTFPYESGFEFSPRDFQINFCIIEKVMCPVPPSTTTTTVTSTTNDKNDDEDDATMSSSPEETSLNRERSKKQRIYDYDSDAETEVWQLSAIATDWTLMINRLAANCRNISDEVFPGIHVGDRLRFVRYF